MFLEETNYDSVLFCFSSFKKFNLISCYFCKKKKEELFEILIFLSKNYFTYYLIIDDKSKIIARYFP